MFRDSHFPKKKKERRIKRRLCSNSAFTRSYSIRFDQSDMRSLHSMLDSYPRVGWMLKPGQRRVYEGFLCCRRSDGTAPTVLSTNLKASMNSLMSMLPSLLKSMLMATSDIASSLISIFRWELSSFHVWRNSSNEMSPVRKNES